LKYNLKYIKCERPVGLPKARNIGIKNSNFDMIGFLDDDCLPIRNDLILRASKWLESRNLNIMGVGGPIYVRSTKPNKKYILSYVNTLPGGNCFFKKKFVEKCGGFDSIFDGNYFREDTDLCLKIKKYGKLIFDPKMPVNHLLYRNGGCRRNINQFYLNFFSNTILLILKHKNIIFEIVVGFYYHFPNFIRYLIQGFDEDFYIIKRFKLIKSLIRGIILGFKKYLFFLAYN